VVHSGSGGEETGNSGDIWSHKWTLPSVYATDATQIFAYLTIPEDAKIGVCAHELGHLLFGFPDLYDVDDSSEGIGSWCLMAAGSWNGGGDVPARDGLHRRQIEAGALQVRMPLCAFNAQQAGRAAHVERRTVDAAVGADRTRVVRLQARVV
jgi:M6 family metalloprotease-like protein